MRFLENQLRAGFVIAGTQQAASPHTYCGGFSLLLGRGGKREKQRGEKIFLVRCTPACNFWPRAPPGQRRDEVAKTGKLPNREQILRRMWALANAGAQDAVRLACVGQEDWQGLDRLDLTP